MNDSFQRVFDAPLGSVIAYTDNQPRPPARFKRKLADWERRNGQGVLSRVDKARPEHQWSRDTITLAGKSIVANDGTVLVKINTVYGAGSTLEFSIASVPEGKYLVVTDFAGNDELQGVFETEAQAEAASARHQYSRPKIKLVHNGVAREIIEVAL